MPRRFMELICAENRLIGRAQMSRRLGLFGRAHLQGLAAARLIQPAAKSN